MQMEPSLSQQQVDIKSKSTAASQYIHNKLITTGSHIFILQMNACKVKNRVLEMNRVDKMGHTAPKLAIKIWQCTDFNEA